MARETLIFVLTCLLVVSFAQSASCPSEKAVAPCVCGRSMFWETGINIKCHEIGNEELAKVASNLKGRKVHNFAIEHSKLDSIPHDVFKGVKLSQLKIQRSTLAALTDRDEAFVGLEDHLKQIYISDCAFKEEWDWTLLRNLKKLNDLIIWDNLRLETIGLDVMKASVPNLEYIFFAGNNISFVADRAFDSYEKLRSLTITYSKIRNLKRTMLPDPALELTRFNLRHNLIEQFPEDMFTNMPKLRDLDIGDNQILVLHERTFSPVWKQLNSFYAIDNALRCDCHMSWLLKKRYPGYLGGECASPPELKGKKLTQLQPHDLVCYV